jgi:hypothetical protein
MAEKKKGLLDRFKKNKLSSAITDVDVNDLRHAEALYGYDPVTVTMLLGTGKRVARTRQVIYEKYHYMMGDPIISSALTLHVTNALGGDPATGDRVFIEAAIDNNKAGEKIVKELNNDLAELFNKIAFPAAWNAIGFGDSFARVYSKEKEGITDIYTDEMVWPPLVQPYEKGSQTVGYTIAVGKNYVERLTLKQMVRLKIPRKGYVAQSLVVEKAVRASMIEDDPEELPIQPVLIGGSLLQFAEEPFDWLQTALTGLVSQRIISSIDENLLTVNTDAMTKDQRKTLLDSIKKMLTASKQRVETAISTGEPITERIYHVLPTNGEKQITQVSQFQGTSGAQTYSIEDVLTYLKMLAGALGLDITLLGFADLLSGGLGEGGFFRTSAQAAEVSQLIRTALNDFFHDIIDLHCHQKYGYVFDPDERPYKINFYGSISALESEKADSRDKMMNGTMMMGQALGVLKDLGLTEDTLKVIMTEDMAMDQDIAAKIAKDLAKAAKDALAAEGGGDLGGGDDFGGDNFDDQEPEAKPFGTEHKEEVKADLADPPEPPETPKKPDQE